VHSVTSLNQTHPHVPLVQLAVINEALTTESRRTGPSSAGEMLQNTPVQRLKGGDHIAGLPIGRLVTCRRELVSSLNVKTTGRKLDDELTAGCQKLC